MARPSKDLDLDLIEKLAAIHCTNTEIAATIGCDSSLLSKPRYSEIITKGRERGKLSLRRKMWDTANNGNVTMMIWLSKQYLGFTDKQATELSGPGGEAIKIVIEDYGTQNSVTAKAKAVP